MTIYRMTGDSIEAVDETTFASVSVSERGDLQRHLKRQVEIISPDTLIIAEEFSDWEDSRRRVDLLGLDPDGTIVVIELKRTEDGGHMELQAIRYAAMVSTLDFDRVVRIFESYLKANGDDRDAREVLDGHLDDSNEDSFAQDVRIVLASAEFSRELTTSVLWLNERGLDIRCVRIKPYGDRENLLLDVQQIIPLPDAQDYITRFKEKQQKEREARKGKQREPCNNLDFYVSLGGHRDWELWRKFGYICAGGGRFYSGTLTHLQQGHRVFVNVPKTGFVGVGEVVETVKSVNDFTVTVNGSEIPVLNVPEIQPQRFDHNSDDVELCEYFVRVRWLETVSADNAFWARGLFASQHSACKLRHDDTIKAVCQRFGISTDN